MAVPHLLQRLAVAALFLATFIDADRSTKESISVYQIQEQYLTEDDRTASILPPDASETNSYMLPRQTDTVFSTQRRFSQLGLVEDRSNHPIKQIRARRHLGNAYLPYGGGNGPARVPNYGGAVSGGYDRNGVGGDCPCARHVPGEFYPGDLPAGYSDARYLNGMRGGVMGNRYGAPDSSDRRYRLQDYYMEADPEPLLGAGYGGGGGHGYVPHGPPYAIGGERRGGLEFENHRQPYPGAQPCPGGTPLLMMGGGLGGVGGVVSCPPTPTAAPIVPLGNMGIGLMGPQGPMTPKGAWPRGGPPFGASSPPGPGG